VIPENWKEALPAEFKEVPWLKNVNDVPTLVKNMANAQKMIGADKIPVPAASATPEEWQGVFKKLGLPETVDKYDLDLDPKLPVDKTFLEEFKKSAHSLGVLPKQGKALVEWFSELNKKTWEGINKEQETAAATALQGLKTEWGQAYDQNIVFAQAALKEFAPTKEMQDHLRGMGIGRDPQMLKFLTAVGKTLAEDKIKGLNLGGGGAVRTPAEALAAIKEIQMNPKHPYSDVNHPEHQKAKKEVTALFEMAYPNTQKGT
jgi:hypothetical protein